MSARDGILQLRGSEADLKTRRAAWAPEPAHSTRGYAKLYLVHVQQAHLVADLDFLVGKDTRPVTRKSH